MKVSLDATAVPASPAGAGRYVVELAAALATRAEPDLVLLTRRGDQERWRARHVSEMLAVAPSARPLRLAWEQLFLPRLLGRIGVDVHHAPHYTMPERSPVPVVVTVHDCTFFDHPEWHERSKVALFRRAIRVAARRAGAIVCVSATTARRLEAVCSVTVPIVVAPHGVDHERFSAVEQSPGADARALESVGVSPASRLVLFVGTVEPRKGVPALVRAFSSVAALHEDATLLIAGRRGWGVEPVDAALEAAGASRERILWPGYVPDEVLPALLRRAAVVAYPSLGEGYGLPALEAMACGAPLVTTAGTAMAELAGDAAILVAPGDVDALAGALDHVLGVGRADADVLRRREAGLSIAAGHTWAASAAQHAEAYRIAAGA